MPGFITDKCDEIRRWLAVGDEIYPNTVVTSWIRMAEEQLSNVLRIKHQIQIDTTELIEDRVPLPKDWQEVRLVRLLKTGGVGRYQTPDAFYNPEFPEDPTLPYTSRNKRYTILGNLVIFGDVDKDMGTDVELTYYQDVTPLTEEANNWINRYHPTLYTLKILHVASMYSIEDERSMLWGKEVAQIVGDLNAAHKVDRASGSVLVQTRRKSFG